MSKLRMVSTMSVDGPHGKVTVDNQGSAFTVTVDATNEVIFESTKRAFALAYATGTLTLTDTQLEEMTEYALGLPRNMSWDDVLYRIEKAFDVDLPTDMSDFTIAALQSEIRRARKEAAE